MRLKNNQIVYSPTDLAHFINCKHLIELKKKEARSEIAPPEKRTNRVAKRLQERGVAFEAEYLESLKRQGLNVKEIQAETDEDRAKAERETLEAMRAGYDVIYQARLLTNAWSGWADFLMKVNTPSNLGDWSYEVWDTKLANQTKAGTLLQIGLYSQCISQIQGVDPEYMGVKKPDGEERFRYHDYAAYIRLIQSKLEASLNEELDTYPEPVSHCDLCDWWSQCNAKRRADDHLTFVAGMSNSQIVELKSQNVTTLRQLANLENPVGFEPSRGNVATYNKLQEQAKIQFESRNNRDAPMYKLLPITENIEDKKGLLNLPEPSKHDVYLDLEGARMLAPDGLEYLIGYVYQGEYTALWAKNEAEEVENFKIFMDFVCQVKDKNPEMHIYHYAPYEPTAFKRLMGKYATRENEVDELLRSETFVDLYRILRQSLIASVERYSLKDLEIFFGYKREMDLRRVSEPKANFEHLLEINETAEATEAELQIIEAYNKDDCKALVELQQWLEAIRAQEIRNGANLPRPELKQGEANDSITEYQQRIKPLFDALSANLPIQAGERTRQQQAQYLLAHFLDWYRRENKSFWWEYYRLLDLELDELMDERKALAYLQFTGETHQVKRSFVHTYSYPPQEVDLRIEDEVQNQESETIGKVYAIDEDRQEIKILKGPSKLGLAHPDAIIQFNLIKADEKEESLIRLANWIIENGVESEEKAHKVVRKLLLRKPPIFPEVQQNSNQIQFALNVLLQLNGDYLAIQGPPGAGKSYTASHLIVELVKQGKRIGVTAMSHKVITNLLNKTYELGLRQGINLNIAQKTKNEDDVPWTVVATDNAQMASLVQESNIIAGTSFMWARNEFYNAVDYMFVDEAGQLSLIDTVALAQAATNLVLLGDPNQLQQPQQGVHPSGTEVSALTHILGDNQTIQSEQGIFLETTWRMHPTINQLVSELFYQNRLKAEDHLGRQMLNGHADFKAGLHLIEINHEGNTSSSKEEVAYIAQLVNKLTDGNLRYTDQDGNEKPITAGDIKIISPYNAQVNYLQRQMPNIAIGTVDKFQGQEAPIIIYSVASSSPADAPRGMDFLYSPNRINVAISRAKVLFIMVASPDIFDAACKTPKEMKLANAFSRFWESTHEVNH